MTLKERLLAALQGKLPDRVPFFPVLRFWWAQQEEKGILPERWKTENGLVRLHSEYLAGLHWPPENHWHVAYGRCSERRKIHDLERITDYDTPLGALQRIERFLPESQCWAPVSWPVRSQVDLRTLRYLIADRHFLPDLGALEAVRHAWNDQGVPLLLPPVRSPVCALVYEWAGVEGLTYLAADYPADVEGTLKALQRADDPVFEILCQWPDAVLVEFNDNLSSEVMTGFIRRYGKDYYAQRNQQLHLAGKLVSVHIDGTLRGLLRMLGELGFDCAEGITPLPTGDVDIQDLRALAGESMRLWGGLPGAIFSPTFPTEDFCRVAVHALEVCRRDPRLILGTGDLFPPDGILERIRWVSDLVESRGTYL